MCVEGPFIKPNLQPFCSCSQPNLPFISFPVCTEGPVIKPNLQPFSMSAPSTHAELPVPLTNTWSAEIKGGEGAPNLTDGLDSLAGVFHAQLAEFMLSASPGNTRGSRGGYKGRGGVMGGMGARYLCWKLVLGQAATAV